MDTTSTAPAAALPATALPVGADAAMWQDIAGASMEADFESDLAHALALSQESPPEELLDILQDSSNSAVAGGVQADIAAVNMATYHQQDADAEAAAEAAAAATEAPAEAPAPTTAPVETAATEADAGIRPVLKKFKAAAEESQCPICLEPFYPRAQVTACPQCFSGVTHAGNCTMTLKDAPLLLTRATGDIDDERFFKLCCLSLPPSLSLSLSLSSSHSYTPNGLCRSVQMRFRHA